jgi:cadmium resistance protein CadD (predicted permease)
LNSEPSRPAEIKVEEKPEPASEPADNSSNARFFWGTVLILIGLLIIAQQFWWSFDFIRGMIRNFFRFFIPAVLIALGIFVILQGSNTSKRKNN